MSKLIENKSEFFIKIKKNKKLLISIIMTSIIIFLVLAAPLIAPYGYEEMNTGPRLSPSSKDNIFGTDHFGRDLFSRVLYGIRCSLFISILVVVFANLIGLSFGLLSGYIGGKFDIVTMRIVDIIFTIPWVLFGISIAIIVGRGMQAVIISLSIVYSPQIARVVRGMTLSLKEKEFVQTGIISGENTFFILSRYIFPNSLSSIIVVSTMILAFSMLSEAGLSYLGYGVAPPIPSLGLLLQDATKYYVRSTYLVYFPGLAISFSVLSIIFLGDGLRDLLDPKFSPI